MRKLALIALAAPLALAACAQEDEVSEAEAADSYETGTLSGVPNEPVEVEPGPIGGEDLTVEREIDEDAMSVTGAEVNTDTDSSPSAED